jgi:large subunit ribosomal protein L2
MGKRLIIQRRGRGTPTYKSASHRFKGRIAHRMYDEIEKEGSIQGKVIDIIHDPGRSAPLALVNFENNEKLLILAPESIKIDDDKSWRRRKIRQIFWNLRFFDHPRRW